MQLISAFRSLISFGSRTAVLTMLVVLMTNTVVVAEADTAKSKILNKLAKELMHSDAERAKAYAKEASLIADRLGQIDEYIIACNNIGIILYNQGKFTEALGQYHSALMSSIAINSISDEARAYSNIGQVYNTQAKYSEALEYYMKAIRLQEKINDKASIAISHFNMGNVFESQESFSKAIQHYYKAIEIDSVLGDNYGLAYDYASIAMCYNSEGSVDRALMFNRKSLDLRIDLNDSVGIARAYGAYGQIFRSASEPAQAKRYLLKGYHLFKRQGLVAEETMAMSDLAKTYLALNQIDSSIYFAKSAVNKSREIDTKSIVQSAYKTLYECYYKLNDAANTYKYFIAFDQIKDSILNQTTRNQFVELQTSYETEKKEQEIELLNKEAEIKAVDLSRQKIFSFGTFIVLLVVVFGAWLLKKANTEKEKTNIQLEEKNIEIQDINNQLERLSVVARETDNVVMIINKSGTIEWVNESFQRITGYTFDELKEHYQSDSIYEWSNNPMIRDILNQCATSRQSVQFEAINDVKQGRKKVWMSSTVTPVFGKNNELSQFIMIDTDITQRKLDGDLIQQKNKDITDSINYAQRIQQAILTSSAFFEDIFEDHFIFFKPKDIVSGDFYWAYRNDKNDVFWAAIDCTGHGVPGAFMSMIGNSLLNEIVVENGVDKPAEILTMLRDRVIKSLDQNNQDKRKDGMDMAICKYDAKRSEVTFSGANNPLWHVSGGVLSEFKANKQPVGDYLFQHAFVQHTISVKKGDMIFLSTDGFPDQFGGEKSKKYKYSPFKKLLMKGADKGCDAQLDVLQTEFLNWKGSNNQVDDVCVIGVRI